MKDGLEVHEDRVYIYIYKKNRLNYETSIEIPKQEQKKFGSTESKTLI